MKLIFSKGQIFDRFNFEQLPFLLQKQGWRAIQNAWGAVSLGEAWALGAREQMAWEYFTVSNEAGEPLYAAWILGDDSGTFFRAGEAAEVGVEMCQSYIDAVVSAPEAELLAHELQEAYREARKSFEDAAAYWEAFYAKCDREPLNEAYWATAQAHLEV